MSTYETARIAVDPVIFTVRDKKLFVLLQEREKTPFQGFFELPGGLLTNEETAEEALKRKLTELFPEFKSHYFEQFFTFTAPDRDPRERTVSVGFITLIAAGIAHHDVKTSWHEVSSVKKMAFDHLAIVKQARELIQNRTDLSVAKHLLPKYFRLNEVQEMLEVIQDKKLDNRNFRRWALSSEALVETDKMSTGTAFRPAKLYTFKNQRA
jgi:8-oxo-dGTP diphosphatase